MKITSLCIKDYNILQDFQIEFSSNLSVLIGENGSGKSSIMECIAYIFGHLHKYFVLNDRTAEFIDGYRINYSINGLDVFIESRYAQSDTNTFNPIIQINGKDVSINQLKRDFPDYSFLPNKVIMSYSGITKHLEELNLHFEKKYIQKIIRQNNPYSLNPLILPSDNPFIYIKDEYVSFILLALFVLNTDEANALIDSLGIDINGCTTTITLKKPYWAKSNTEKNNTTNVWGVSGKIAQDLFDGLSTIAIYKDIAKEQNILKYELYGAIMVRDLFIYYNLDSSQVLSFLDTLLCDDLLESVNIVWNNVFSVDKLSEGEKQIILSVGLSLILNKSNILFLLDEPDVSLHPKLQQEFLNNFTKGLNEDSMAIITSHNPIIIGNSNREDIHIIKDGKEMENEYYSRGRDINSLLYDYFNIHERNSFGEDLIKRFYNAMNNKNYELAENILAELRTTFGDDDIEVIKADSMFDDLAE